MTSSFNIEWMDQSLNPQFASWVRPVRDHPNKALCSFCQKTFSLSNMGRRSLLSHMESEKHNKYGTSGTPQIASFFKKYSSKSSAVSNPVTPSSSQQSADSGAQCLNTADKNPQTLSTYVRKNVVTKSEVLWALKVVANHFSYNSSKDLGEIFKLMFPDSNIAKKLSIGSSKLSYLITHGLAPYFHDELLKLVDSKFVICFDEAFNQISKKGQMDIVLRFWDNSINQVSSRYLSSAFMGHSTAKDILENFLDASSELKMCNLLQVSMDGPNVNWSFLEQLTSNHHDEYNTTMLFLGSCGLHVINGALQTGHKAASWKVQLLLKSFYKIFKDSPARRSDYTNLTECSLFPKKFCSIRWVENADVCQRALEVFKHVKTYITKAKKLPATFTVKAVKEACSDPLSPAKIAFFSSVASVLEPFLRRFQTAAPFAPFLYAEIFNILQILMKRFIKSSIMDEATTPAALRKMDIASVKLHREPKDIDIGTAAKSLLANANVPATEKLAFRSECCKFLVAVVSKIFERSPLNYKIVRAISCFVPGGIVNSRSLSEKKFECVTGILFDREWVSAAVADKAKVQFSSLCFKASDEWLELFNRFDWNKDRLDVFYYNIIGSKQEFCELWAVCQMIFILSHGNASVESGFSVNGDILVENLKETSLVAQRRVYDAIISKGGVLRVDITSKMLMYANQSHSRYQECLKRNRDKILAVEQKAKERKRAAEQIKVLHEKRSKLKENVRNELSGIDREIAELEMATKK